MIKVYAVTKTETGNCWKYKDAAAVGETVWAACRQINGFWKIKGYAEKRGHEWCVKSYRYIRHPYLEPIQSE